MQMTCRWELGPVCSVTPCCWDERLDTGQKTGTAFTVRTAFAKHQNICLTPPEQVVLPRCHDY